MATRKAKMTQDKMNEEVQLVAADVEVLPLPSTVVGTAADAVAQILCEHGILLYFQTRSKTVQDSKSIVKTCAQFLNWAYVTVHNTDIAAASNAVMQWWVLVIKEKYDLLLQYSRYLQERQQLRATTVSKYVSAVESCCVWLTLFAPAHVRLPMSDIEGIRSVAQLVRAGQKQRNKQVRSHITLEQKVRLSQLPAGGLSALQHAVLQELAWARGVRLQAIDDIAYRRFMQTMFAALYVCSPNGRQSGVVDIKLRQAEELLQQCYTTSTQFKTHNKYGYQPVTVEGASHELVNQYVTAVRPQVRRAPPEDNFDEPLWLNYAGERETDVGRLVTSFFTRTCGCTVTITAIRSLVETTMHKKHKEGKITEAQRTAVQNINGHSSEITKAYYLLEDRADDVLCSRGVLANDFDAALTDLVNDMDPDELLSYTAPEPLPRPLPLPLPQPPAPSTPWRYAPSRSAAPAAIDWGTSHPDYNDDSKGTAIWTQEEKSFLGHWCDNFRREFPEVKSVVAKCLEHIRTNAAAIRIFHKHHTLTSARLRNGLRQYGKDKEDNHNLHTYVHNNDDMY